MPSLIEGIIDIIGLVTVVSGVFVEVDCSNAFVYVFILCMLIFIFTKGTLKE